MAAVNVLIIEDLIIAQKAAAHLFAKLNCKLFIASSAANALEILFAKQFDIIFIDIQLPDMNGFELAETIHTIRKRPPKIPLIAVTANSNEELAHKSRSAGFDDYLLKPLTIESVRYIFSKHLKILPMSIFRNLDAA